MLREMNDGKLIGRVGPINLQILCYNENMLVVAQSRQRRTNENLIRYGVVIPNPS